MPHLLAHSLFLYTNFRIYLQDERYELPLFDFMINFQVDQHAWSEEGDNNTRQSRSRKTWIKPAYHLQNGQFVRIIYILLLFGF